ncbi:MAG: glycosyltransferase family 2 protein [Patescibacteria group bacterium]
MAKKKNQKVVIVMPAYNAARTVKDTLNEIPTKYKKHVILVDDQSKDNTVAVSKKLGITTFAHPNNLGYGGNQKTCYWEALKLDPAVVVMLHPDFQYDAKVIPQLVQPILDGKYDYVFGSRMSTQKGALKGGMPLHKYILNRTICFIQNKLLGVNFSEHFSGYRAYSKKLLLTIPFQRYSNDFGFDQEMAISAISYKMRIGEVPIITRYHKYQSTIKFLKGTKFLLDGFATIAKYLLHKAGIVNDNRFAPRNYTNKTPKSKSLLALTFLVLINFFFKPSADLNFSLGLFIFIQSVLLFFLISNFKNSKLIRKIILLILPIIIGVFILITGVYKDIFYVSNFEKNQLWVRKEIYRRDLGLIGRFNFSNLAIETTKLKLDQLTRKITPAFDLNKYFSIDKLSIYLTIFFPLFVLGSLFLLAEELGVFLYYLGVATLGALFVQPGLIYWLFVPLINLGILFGIINIKRVFIKTK